MSGGSGNGEDSNGWVLQRIPKRHKTIKKAELSDHNYVYDVPVPSKLLQLCSNRSDREYTHLRYTGAICDPSDFMKEGYTLRQVLHNPPRRTELFIMITIYDEDEILFCKTMHAVMKNIAHLCTRERSKTWGTEAWEKVVVCIISDGRTKINSRTLSAMAVMGIYQDGIAKSVVNKKEVVAHIYEYTTQVSITSSLSLEGSEMGTVPVQVIFCLKEKTQNKINSHRWFFNAFGPILQPNICVLLHVGMQPGPKSIYHLWKTFDISSNVGGACGEIVVEKGKFGVNLLNPLVAAQYFEYKMSHILERPLESVLGYITVIPGAFSAYRYIALQDDSTGEGPLQKYFLGEKKREGNVDTPRPSMYRVEDRILPWELVSKRGGSWILHYTKSAYAVTDVPNQVSELISQRRGWLNGSLFTTIYGIVNFSSIYRSSHSFWRKFWIHVELVYQVFNLVFSWFALGNYYIAFVVLSESMENLNSKFHYPNEIMRYAYLGLLATCFLLRLENRSPGSYITVMIGFGFITCYMIFAVFFLTIKIGLHLAAEQKDHTLSFIHIFIEPRFGQMVFSLLFTLGLYITASVLFFDPWHMITSFLQYLLLVPSYIAVFNVYTFSNVRNISLGSKGDVRIAIDHTVASTSKLEDKKTKVESIVPTDEKDINSVYDNALYILSTKPPKVEQKEDERAEQEDCYESFRTNVLLAWTLSNGLLAAVVTVTTVDKSGTLKEGANVYMYFLLYSLALLSFVRFIGSTTYMLIWLFGGE